MLLRLSIINAFLLEVIYAAEYLASDQFWPATWLAYIPQHPYGIASIVLVFWALVRRKWGLLLFNGIVALAFVWIFLGFNIPFTKAARPDLRVMSFNVAPRGAGAMDVVKLIQTYQLDVVALQESNTEIARNLRALLPGWSVAHAQETTTLSRFPILAQQTYPLPRLYRVLLLTVLDLKGRRIVIANAHLGTVNLSGLPNQIASSTINRLEQLEAVLARSEKRPEPVILLGDFNTPPRTNAYRRIAQNFYNAFAQSGWGFGYTYSSTVPMVRIDHIWYNPSWQSVRSFVPNFAASDHRPLIAELALSGVKP